MRVGDDWSVLVLLGASGTGKSICAAEIARRRRITWMQVDDLRLALQYSRITLSNRTDELYFFERTADIWSRPLDELRRAFINVAEVMAPAVRVVIDSHVATGVPMVDGILPALAVDPVLCPHVAAGTVRFCCVQAGGVDELLANMVARGRGMGVDDAATHRAHAAANDAFGAWLAGESRRLGIPVVASQPFAMLVDRVLGAVASRP